ncbi:CoA transferase, partial [Chloroflexi bacterium]|nr:CoA transferase [Chloroflexota bacterium]
MSSKCPDTTQDQVLYGVKIIDLTGPAGFYCSKLLADLGADVIRIEDSSTAATENYAPFYEGVKHIDNSLYRWHFHTNKRSVELNLTSKKGKEIFLGLLGVADVLITTEPESKIAHLKMGTPEIRTKHPKLIHTSIRAFSSQSVYSNYKATDIVALAMSGLMAITGFPEDPP